MSNRQDQEREKELQPKRLLYAKEQITKLGYDILFECDTRIEFEYIGERVSFYPYSGWHSGRSIKDGRGLKKLLNQMK